jgi:hypothetical protein
MISSTGGLSAPGSPRQHVCRTESVDQASPTGPVDLRVENDDVPRAGQPMRLELPGELRDDVDAAGLRGAVQRVGESCLEPVVKARTYRRIDSRQCPLFLAAVMNGGRPKAETEAESTPVLSDNLISPAATITSPHRDARA